MHVAVHESAPGPERHLLRDNNTSEIGGQSGNGRRTLKTSLIDPQRKSRRLAFGVAALQTCIELNRPAL